MVNSAPQKSNFKNQTSHNNQKVSFKNQPSYQGHKNNNFHKGKGSNQIGQHKHFNSGYQNKQNYNSSNFQHNNSNQQKFSSNKDFRNNQTNNFQQNRDFTRQNGFNRGNFQQNFNKSSKECRMCGKYNHEAIDRCPNMVNDNGKLIHASPQYEHCKRSNPCRKKQLMHKEEFCPYRTGGPLAHELQDAN